MKISELRSLLMAASANYPHDSDERAALSSIIAALSRHDAATVDGLVSKLQAVSIKPPAARRVRKPTAADGAPRKSKPKPSKEDVARAKSEAFANLRKAYLDDDTFRTTLADVSMDERLTSTAARELFAMFFELRASPAEIEQEGNVQTTRH